MSTTPNLLIPHMTATQNQKEVTANDAWDKLDKALCGLLSKNVAGGSDVTLTAVESLENMYLDLTGTITANINVKPNSTYKKLYIVRNSTTGAFTVTFKTAAGTGVTIGQGAVRFLYCDGTNIVAVASEDTGGSPLAWVPGFFPGQPASSQLVLLYPIPAGVKLTFPANMTGSNGRTVTAPTGSISFSIRKNNSQFATMDIAAGANVATFTGSQTTLDGDQSPADYLSVIAPGTADATLADIGWSYKGTR